MILSITILGIVLIGAGDIIGDGVILHGIGAGIATHGIGTTEVGAGITIPGIGTMADGAGITIATTAGIVQDITTMVTTLPLAVLQQSAETLMAETILAAAFLEETTALATALLAE